MKNGNLPTLQINCILVPFRNPDSLLMKMRRTFQSSTTTILVSQLQSILISKITSSNNEDYLMPSSVFQIIDPFIL